MHASWVCRVKSDLGSKEKDFGSKEGLDPHLGELPYQVLNNLTGQLTGNTYQRIHSGPNACIPPMHESERMSK